MRRLITCFVISLIASTMLSAMSAPAKVKQSVNLTNTAARGQQHSSNDRRQKQMQPPLKTLMQASRFVDGVRGEQPDVASEYKAYLEAYEQLANISSTDLQRVLTHGTPAGKLYAASLLRAKGEISRSACYASLLDDKTEVDYQSGCRGTRTSVSDIAHNLLSSDKYLNFTPVPNLVNNAAHQQHLQLPKLKISRAELRKKFVEDGGITVPFKKERFYAIDAKPDSVGKVQKFDAKFKPAGMTDEVYFLGKWAAPKSSDHDTLMEISMPYLEKINLD